MARRNSPNGEPADPALSQKKRARRRLIGAAAVALAAAIALPLILDSEPQKRYPDVQVTIPSRDGPARLVPPGASPVAQAGAAHPSTGTSPADLSDESGQVGADDAAGAPSTTAVPSPNESPSSSPADGSASTPRAPAAKAPGPRSDPKPTAPSGSSRSGEDTRGPAAPAAAKTDTATAKPAAKNTSARVALQLGAFASESSAKAMVERARQGGVQTYTEKIKMADGTRTRVRVGPFPDRDEAERMRGKLKLVGIESRIVSAQSP